MFSVIIPLYNKAEYISKAVLSVLSQTFKDFELIIVNDGSTDTSLEKVQKTNDPRIRILNQENAGVSVARNNGAKKARHKYLAFLDADDWWDADYLKEMGQLILKYPDAGIWAAKYYKVKCGKNIEANVGLESNFTEGYISYFKVYAKTMWMPITSSSFIITKNIFSEYKGYKPRLQLGEDFELWVRIALKYEIAFLNKPLVYYNQDVGHENRAIGSTKFYKPENHFLYQIDYLYSIEQNNIELKILLDKIRVQNLLKYHLFSEHKNETKSIVNQIVFTNQPFYVRLQYKLPIYVARQYYNCKMILSNIKSRFLT